VLFPDFYGNMNKRLLLHAAFWLAYVVEDTIMEYAWIRFSFPKHTDWEVFLIALQSDLLLLIPKFFLVYFILYVSIPRFHKKETSYLRIFSEMTLVLVASIVIHRLLIHYPINRGLYGEAWEDVALFEPKRILSSLLDIGFVAGGAVAIKLFRLFLQGREREKNLYKERLEAELKFLRTQTNPHFLFNTLNNIYALARKKSDETADVVMKLSKILRFMLYESKKDRISIEEDLRILEDYMELERIRYNERLSVSFQREIDNGATPIAPLILLPFVENAFKHGASETRFNSFINIDLKLNKGILNFMVENSKENHAEELVVENIGLGNVRRQLELMYADHSLRVQNNNDRFRVDLSINLNSYATI